MFRFLVALAVVSAGWSTGISATPATPPAPYVIEPLALDGDIAPGVANANYTSPPRWNSSSRNGLFSWQATLSNGQEGIWVNDSQGTRLLALAGPGAPFTGIYDQPSGAINSSGDVALVQTPTTTDLSNAPHDIIVTDGVTQRFVYRAGQRAPGFPIGTTIDPGPSRVRITDNDVVAFKRDISGSTVTPITNTAWWVGTPGNVELLIREGDPAPGLPGEFIGQNLGAIINDSGYAATYARLASGVIGNAIWAGTPGDLELISFRGIPAPDTNGLVFTSNGIPAVEESNSLVFNAIFEDPTTNQPAGVGLYRGPRDNLQLVFGPDDPSPFLGEEITSLNSVRINRTGDAAMRAVLQDGSNTSRQAIIKVDLDDPSLSTIIAAQGDLAPSSGGARFDSFSGAYLMNDRGDVFLSAYLQGFQPGGAAHGLYVMRDDGPLQLIAHLGQSIEVPTSGGITNRTISEINWQTGIAENGSVSFRLGFTDGSYGLFAAQPTVVPEPSGCLLVLLASMLGVVAYRCKTVSRVA